MIHKILFDYIYESPRYWENKVARRIYLCLLPLALVFHFIVMVSGVILIALIALIRIAIEWISDLAYDMWHD